MWFSPKGDDMTLSVGLYRFKFNWIAVLITLVAFILLARLGSWQLSRAVEKEQRLEQIEQYKKLNEISLTDVLQISESYDPTGVTVKLNGSFASPQSWLLDNKIVKGKTGYDVLLALQVLGQKHAVLVNMGWIRADYAQRDVLPSFDIPAGEVAVTGFVKAKDLASFALSNESINNQAWPQRTQQIHLDILEQQSGLTFHPFVVYAQQDDDFGFTHHYQPVVMPPQKHRAYALQWFLLSIAVVVIFILASRESNAEKIDEQS